MQNKKAAFLTLGCKVNSYESDAMEKLLKDAGYEIVDFETAADIYVINTCSVTNMADHKSRQMLHKAKKINPNGIVIATGCYAQTATKEALYDMSVDIVIGNNQKKNIVEIIEKYSNDSNQREAVIAIENDSSFEEMPIDSTDEKTRAYIKIQDGCNQFCSYCIIPYARGRIRSRKKEDIVSEVKALSEAGYKEVVLTGIHISSYGMDFEKEKNNSFRYEHIYELICELTKIEKIKRIRLGSLEPRIINEEFIEKLSKNDKVCPHFHLSLQSGCDETLKRMNRKYSTEEFFEKCNILRKYYDRPAITTDVIVGFPGETKEEFEMTTKFLEKVNFSQMHIFKYSVRKGTVAEKMPNQIPEQTKTQRSKILLEMTRKQHIEYMKNIINEKQLILLEENVEIDGERYSIGHNERYIKVAVREDNTVSNEIKTVTIKNILKDDILLGEY